MPRMTVRVSEGKADKRLLTHRMCCASPRSDGRQVDTHAPATVTTENSAATALVGSTVLPIFASQDHRQRLS